MRPGFTESSHGGFPVKAKPQYHLPLSLRQAFYKSNGVPQEVWLQGKCLCNHLLFLRCVHRWCCCCVELNQTIQANRQCVHLVNGVPVIPLNKRMKSSTGMFFKVLTKHQYKWQEHRQEKKNNNSINDKRLRCIGNPIEIEIKYNKALLSGAAM